MNRPTLALALLAATLAFGTTAHAQTSEDNSFAGMTAMERMDKNKDKLVSKAEFLEMMGKLWDMKAKDMKLKAAGAEVVVASHDAPGPGLVHLPLPPPLHPLLDPIVAR